MFVRKKTIKGRQYYYLVKSVRQEDRVRQEIIEYLGTQMPTKKRIKELESKHR